MTLKHVMRKFRGIFSFSEGRTKRDYRSNVCKKKIGESATAYCHQLKKLKRKRCYIFDELITIFTPSRVVQ